jgi:hypothetical protein
MLALARDVAQSVLAAADRTSSYSRATHGNIEAATNLV